MHTEPTTRNAFVKRAELWNDKAPLFAALCRMVAEDLDLAAPVDDGPDLTGRDHCPVWSRPHRLFGLITRTLRTHAAGHALAKYWPTLGGRRPIDDAMADAFRDFSVRHRGDLADLGARLGSPRQNDPLAAAALWPGIAWAAVEVAGPVALLELGSAAGVCLYADKFGYRYGGRTIRGDSALVLELGFDGAAPGFLDADVDVVARFGLEREPVRREDPEAIAWLRDCVFPDEAGKLADLDNALSMIEPGGVDWRSGDYMETLPGALSDVPAGATPVVFGAHTLCCADDAARLPRILEQSGRDLMWIAKEHADNALGLVSEAASEFATEDGEPPAVLLTAVHYRAGRPSSAWVLGEGAPLNTGLTWAPREVPLR